ncbi:DUF3052 family protein [Kitasatospora camelliae]|uniref:DUF3052 family protein n=1 Tax=Kitasatospora camelliae TaxID=3156397 RepID=A0AAU8JNP4_9ACTN
MASTVGVADKLGIEPKMLVQALGWVKDSDQTVRASVEERTGPKLLDGDACEVVDMVLLWWRDNDGDLVDPLVDALGPLAENGVIWAQRRPSGSAVRIAPSARRRNDGARPTRPARGRRGQ